MWHEDGLSNLDYEVVHNEKLQLYVNLVVRLKEKESIAILEGRKDYEKYKRCAKLVNFLKKLIHQIIPTFRQIFLK